MDSIVEKGKGDCKITMDLNSPEKKPFSSTDKKQSPSKNAKNSDHNIYAFGSFPEKKPTPGLR